MMQQILLLTLLLAGLALLSALRLYLHREASCRAVLAVLEMYHPHPIPSAHLARAAELRLPSYLLAMLLLRQRGQVRRLRTIPREGAACSILYALPRSSGGPHV